MHNGISFHLYQLLTTDPESSTLLISCAAFESLTILAHDETNGDLISDEPFDLDCQQLLPDDVVLEAPQEDYRPQP